MRLLCNMRVGGYNYRFFKHRRLESGEISRLRMCFW